jgi:hypothetical protein
MNKGRQKQSNLSLNCSLVNHKPIDDRPDLIWLNRFIVNPYWPIPLIYNFRSDHTAGASLLKDQVVP